MVTAVKTSNLTCVFLFGKMTVHYFEVSYCHAANLQQKMKLASRQATEQL
jgi:hypothetical protein